MKVRLSVGKKPFQGYIMICHMYNTKAAKTKLKAAYGPLMGYAQTPR